MDRLPEGRYRRKIKGVPSGNKKTGFSLNILGTAHLVFPVRYRRVSGLRDMVFCLPFPAGIAGRMLKYLLPRHLTLNPGREMQIHRLDRNPSRAGKPVRDNDHACQEPGRYRLYVRLHLYPCSQLPSSHDLRISKSRIRVALLSACARLSILSWMKSYSQRIFELRSSVARIGWCR